MTLVLVVQCSLRITQGLIIAVLKPLLDTSTLHVFYRLAWDSFVLSEPSKHNHVETSTGKRFETAGGTQFKCNFMFS